MKTLIAASLLLVLTSSAHAAPRGGDTSLRDLKKSIADIDKTLADAGRDPSFPLGQPQRLSTVPYQPLPQPSILLPLRR